MNTYLNIDAIQTASISPDKLEERYISLDEYDNAEVQGSFLCNELECFNDIMCGGNVYSSSDERLKTFTKPITVNFDDLINLKKSYFRFNGNPCKQHIGVSAQEIKEIYPEIVTEDEETGFLSVDYSKLSVIALAAIDKLIEKNNELEKRISQLEEKIK